MRRALGCSVVLAVAAVQCGNGGADAPSAGRVGSSIALVEGGAGVVVVNPDQGSVSVVDATTLDARATVDVGGEPHELLPMPDQTVLVATYRGGEIVRIDPAKATVVARRALCAGPYGLATTPDEASVLVTCEWEGALLRLDAKTLETRARFDGFTRPRAVAALGPRVVVAEYTGGLVKTIDAAGATTATSLVPASAPYRPAATAMTANLAAAIVPAFGALHVAHVLENNTGDQSHEKVADDYGSVADSNPKINPALTTLGSGSPVLYAKFDGGSRVFNGPVAMAPTGDGKLLVVHVSTANVAVVDARATTPETRVVGSFTVGAGPHGIAVDDARHVAYVDNAFDRSISRLDLGKPFDPATAPRYEAALTRVRDLPEPYSVAARTGRKLFYDATDTHVTPSAVVVCASCHPEGGDDGLVWFMHTGKIPLKRRRTPHLANAHSATAPFHWDGQFATMGDLVRATMTDLMAGDGLLVDVDSVQAYVDEMVKPPVRPSIDASAEARGKSLFDGEAQCATCHGGSDFTDDAMHSVLSPMSLSPDDAVTLTNTPALHGLFLRAPYLHDGRAASLGDLLTRPDAAPHGATSGLSPGDIQDLVTYLQSL